MEQKLLLLRNVTERLLHEERKLKDHEESEGGRSKVMTAAVFNQNGPKKKITCHYCGRPGHLKRNC